MNPVAGHIARTFAILDILNEQTDQNHCISMNDLVLFLEDRNITAERKAVYKSIHALQDHGYDIRYTRRDGQNGYYIERPWSSSEIRVLIDAVNSSYSLSEKVSGELNQKLKACLSPFEQELVPEGSVARNKTDNDDVLELISKLLHAASKSLPVEFCYYDLTLTRKKQYRRSKAVYRLLPVAVMENSGRYYCVFYSPKHSSFANYRIDKMNSLTVGSEPEEPVRFDAERWAETSFQMYRGDPVTVQLECERSMVPIIFDQFGKNILVSAVGEHTFTVNLKTSISPTLISWILMFYDRITVKAPDELIDRLLEIADSVCQNYRKALK